MMQLSSTHSEEKREGDRAARHAADRMSRSAIKGCVFQSLLATLALAIILYLLDVTIHPVLITAAGSTTFIIFAMPHAVTARPRNVLGGHTLGVLAGVLCTLLLHLVSPLLVPYQEVVRVILYAAAVGLAIAAMLATDTGHPPAAGTALAITINPLNWRMVAFILVSVASLSLVRWLLRSRLVDLM